MTPEEKKILEKLEMHSDIRYQKIKEQNYDLQRKIINLSEEVRILQNMCADSLKFAELIIDRKGLGFVYKKKIKKIIKKILRK